MVKIRKGSMTLTVPNRAYEKVYAPAGWELAEGSKSEQKSKGGKNTESGKNKAEIGDVTKPQGEDTKVEEPEIKPEVEETEEVEEDVEYVDPEELKEKPLEELDFEELIILAEYMGIPTENLRSKKQAREAIKAHQK